MKGGGPFRSGDGKFDLARRIESRFRAARKRIGRRYRRRTSYKHRPCSIRRRSKSSFVCSVKLRWLLLVLDPAVSSVFDENPTRPTTRPDTSNSPLHPPSPDNLESNLVFGGSVSQVTVLVPSQSEHVPARKDEEVFRPCGDDVDGGRQGVCW